MRDATVVQVLQDFEAPPTIAPPPTTVANPHIDPHIDRSLASKETHIHSHNLNNRPCCYGLDADAHWPCCLHVNEALMMILAVGCIFLGALHHPVSVTQLRANLLPPSMTITNYPRGTSPRRFTANPLIAVTRTAPELECLVYWPTSQHVCRQNMVV